MCNQLFDRPRKRIQAAGEQNDFVGRKFCIIRSRQREIGLHRGWSFEQAELKLIVVVRKETDRFDESRNDSIR